MEWNRRKGRTGKTKPSTQFRFEEKFTFQRAISAAVLEYDIPTSLLVKLDQTPLRYVSPGKYTFSFRGAKDVPIKKVDDKRQITGTFAVNFPGKISMLPAKLWFSGLFPHEKVTLKSKLFDNHEYI